MSSGRHTLLLKKGERAFRRDVFIVCGRIDKLQIEVPQ